MLATLTTFYREDPTSEDPENFVKVGTASIIEHTKTSYSCSPTFPIEVGDLAILDHQGCVVTASTTDGFPRVTQFRVKQFPPGDPRASFLRRTLNTQKSGKRYLLLEIAPKAKTTCRGCQFLKQAYDASPATKYQVEPWECRRGFSLKKTYDLNQIPKRPKDCLKAEVRIVNGVVTPWP